MFVASPNLTFMNWKYTCTENVKSSERLLYAHSCQPFPSFQLFMLKLLLRLLLYLTRLCPVTFSVCIRHQIPEVRSERYSPALYLSFINLVYQRYNKILWWVSYKMSLKIERQIRVRFPVECRRYFLIPLFHTYCTPWQSLSVFRWSAVTFSAYLQAVTSVFSYLFIIFSIQMLRKFP
jgi:hypothetical protein